MQSSTVKIYAIRQTCTLAHSPLTHSHLEMCAWALHAHIHTHRWDLFSVWKSTGIHKWRTQAQKWENSIGYLSVWCMHVCAHRTVTCIQRVYGRLLSDVKMRQTIHSYCIRCFYELSASSQPGTGFDLIDTNASTNITVMTNSSFLFSVS